MNHRILEDLYHTTEEDLLYGVGLLALPDQDPAPIIHIHYRNWSREKLEIVRESFRGGLVLTFSCQTGGTRDLHISTRERVAMRATEGDHTSILRAPAWDAHLGGDRRTSRPPVRGRSATVGWIPLADADARLGVPLSG